MVFLWYTTGFHLGEYTKEWFSSGDALISTELYKDIFFMQKILYIMKLNSQFDSIKETNY